MSEQLKKGGTCWSIHKQHCRRYLTILGTILAVNIAAGGYVRADDGTVLSQSPRWAQTKDDKKKVWNFDADKPGEIPTGFSAVQLGDGASSSWKIEPDSQSPSPPNRLIQDGACNGTGCMNLLLFDGFRYDYPDVTVRLRMIGEGPSATGGIVFAAKDSQNFYAVLADLVADKVEVIRVVNGETKVLGQEQAKRKPGAWHFLRAQHNTNLSKDYIEVAFDGQLVFAVWDSDLSAGQIGLATKGPIPIGFDNLFAIQLISQRPLSPPAAY